MTIVKYTIMQFILWLTEHLKHLSVLITWIVVVGVEVIVVMIKNFTIMWNPVLRHHKISFKAMY